MAGLVLLDSNFYIQMARAHEDPFAVLDTAASSVEFAINGIVWIEVIRGRIQRKLRDHYEARFSTMRFLHTTPRTWQRAGHLAWELERSGHTMQTTDAIIATCALEYGAAVLTFDRAFRKVPGLVVLDRLP